MLTNCMTFKEIATVQIQLVSMTICIHKDSCKEYAYMIQKTYTGNCD